MSRRDKTWPSMAVHAAAAVLLVGMLLVSGCQTASTLTMRNKTWHRERGPLNSYDKVDLVYEVNHSESGLKRKTRSWTSARPVSAEESNGELFPGLEAKPMAISAWSKAKIHVVYPHPEIEEADVALVTLRLSRLAPGQIETSYAGMLKKFTSKRAQDDAPEPQSQLGDEIWTTTLSKDQLDLLLKELDSGGVFSKQERPYACSQLSLKVDHDSVSKSWTQEPRLNQLIEHTYQHGQLVGFVSGDQSLESRQSQRKTLLARWKDRSEPASQEVEQVAFEEAEKSGLGIRD